MIKEINLDDWEKIKIFVETNYGQNIKDEDNNEEFT